MDPELLKDLSLLDKTFRSENLNIRNRLLSIHKDTLFLQSVSAKFPNYEICPNERCGLWYVPPADYKRSVYFKSTDGHTKNWGFSIRRLNFHILNARCLIVDSTRRGKISPDSLSKTIPIWCCILNNLLEDSTTFERELYLDSSCVSNLEREMILDQLPNIMDDLRPYLHGSLNIDSLKLQGFTKKLKPYFIHPNTNLNTIENEIENDKDQYTPILLATVSKMVKDGGDKSGGFSYVQGAGDDHELWSNGLTPELFWQNQDQLDFETLVKLSNDEIMIAISELVKTSHTQKRNGEWTKWDVLPLLSFGSIDCDSTIESTGQYDLVIVLEASVKSELENVHIFDLDSGSKKSSKQLRLELPKIMDLIGDGTKKTLILCKNATDLSPCATLCCMAIGKPNISKVSIRQDLIKLIELNPKVNPQRASLNSVNSFLMK